MHKKWMMVRVRKSVRRSIILLGMALALSLAGFFAGVTSGCGGSSGGSNGGNDGSSSGSSSVVVSLSPADGSAGLFSYVEAVFSTVDADVSDDIVMDIVTAPAGNDWGSVLSLTEVGGDGADLCVSDSVTYASDIATVRCAPATPLTKGFQYIAAVSGMTDADGRSIETVSSTFTVYGIANRAGDFDADGYPEVMVGSGCDISNSFDIFSGEAAVLSYTPTLSFEGSANSSFGSRIVSNGDFNGDGIADILVSASAYDYEEIYETAEGTVYIYLGSVSPVSGAAPDLTLTGRSGDATFGVASAAGDFNGDGLDDVIVGEYANNAFVGSVYVFYGSEEMDATADLTLSGSGVEKFGSSTATGDFNNDGYDDGLVGAVTSADGAYVFYGSAEGLNNSNSARVCGDCNSPEGQALGSAVATGDLNGDGFMDAIIGALAAESEEGVVYIHYGSGSGVGLTANTILSYDNTSRLGYSVASTDVNGDGYDDVITSTSYPGGGDSTVYIYFGAAAGIDSGPDVSIPGGPGSAVLSAGDFNVDGTGDIIFGMVNYSNQGRVDVYYGSVGISDNPAPNYTMSGVDVSRGCFGKSVAGGE